MNNSNTQTYIINIVVLVAGIIAKYYINRKAGEKEWYAIIPFYSTYLLYKYADTPNNYFVVLLTTFFGSITFFLSLFAKLIIFFASYSNDYLYYETSTLETIPIKITTISQYSTIGLVIGLILLIIAMVYKFKQCQGLAKNFNASNGFAWILFFFSTIALLILAFDSTYYYLPLQEEPESLDTNIYYE